MSNRLDNTREVVFEEDYMLNGKVIYEKKVKHYIHKDTAEKFKNKGVKVKISNFDEKGEVAKAKQAFEESQKEK